MTRRRSPIMLAISWGVSLGGGGTPIGGAMNQVAISALQDYTGKEFSVFRLADSHSAVYRYRYTCNVSGYPHAADVQKV